MSNPHSRLIIVDDSNQIKVDEHLVLKLQNETQKIIKEVKDTCKILHFSPEWMFEEVLSTIKRLDPKKYPQLFIFVIELKHFGFMEDPKSANEPPNKRFKGKFNENELKDILQTFGHGRPIIFQIKSQDENTSKVYYKKEDSNQFIDIDQDQQESKNLSSLLHLIKVKNANYFKNSVLNALSKFQNRSLALRLLQTLKLPNKFFARLLLTIAKKSTKSEFIAALDSPFDGRMLSNRSQKHIALSENDDSVLFRAVQNKNKEVIKYLINDCTHLIQLLPHDHQVKISTAAFETEQLDVLCELLDYADFPFPKNFKVESVGHEKLCDIIAKRADFKASIEAENYEKIDGYIDKNLKFFYSPSNFSALKEALNLKKYAVFYYLKSLGFKGENCYAFIKKMDSKEEKSEAIRIATNQRIKNINQSLPNIHKSVHKLYAQSTIHYRQINEEQKVEYSKKIMKWFMDIYNVSPQLINVAASCDRLKIIFDFESDNVESASLDNPNASGITYSFRKLIFMGAKLSEQYGNSTKEREQEIKGVLAHELCHYAMKLVYDNNFNPYHKDREDLKESFDKIVQEIDKWSANEADEAPDDQCNNIISSVFENYTKEEFHFELIVRFVQFSTAFDDEELKLNDIKDMYERLVDYWTVQVIPEMEKYLNTNKEVIKLNRLTEMLDNISNPQFQVKPGKQIEELINNKLVIVTTNNPQLLFIDISKNLKQKLGSFIDSKNFFTEPKKLNNSEIWEEFEHICLANQELNIFVDCTRDVPGCLGHIFINKEFNFTFVVSNEQQSEYLADICDKKIMKNAVRMKINYNWSDLTEESQQFLLKKEINFQNNLQISLSDLLRKQNSMELNEDFSEIIDDHLLTMLVKSPTQVAINVDKIDDKNHIEILYNSRRFKNNFTKMLYFSSEFLREVSYQQYVIISDIAGSGKSWAMKKIASVLREENPTSWVTYVDLKQFIDEFKAQNVEFSSFMVNHILKPEQQFEAKIFKKMYKDGKVYILFDGFDEIAPNCAEFVSKLAQNFQRNRGNQLWIATRDYFEVDLKDKLKLYAAYGLDEMTKDEGMDFIAKSWILADLIKAKIVPKSKEDFESRVAESPTYEVYKQKARKIIEKALISRYNSVGLPQLFTLIVDLFKDENDLKNLSMSDLFKTFVSNLMKIFSEQKGKIKNKSSLDIHFFNLNFIKFHEYQAILSMFEELAEILFSQFNGSEWSEVNIIAGGILIIINGKVYFIHKTFSEYFVALSISNALKCKEIEKKVVEVFVDILTDKKYEVIQIFLNDMITDASILTRIQPEVENHVEKFYKMTNFGDFFENNLDNLIDLVLNVLKSGNDTQFKKILQGSDYSVARQIQEPRLFMKFQEFILGFLINDDLKDFMINRNIFHGIIESNLEIELFGDFVAKTEEKTDHETVKKALVMKSNERHKGNIFYFLAKSSNLTAQKVQKFLEILDKYLTVTEIFELMIKCNKDELNIERNILQVCVRLGSKENLQMMWTEIEKYFTNEKVSQTFKEFVKQQNKQNILYDASWCDKIEVYQTLWTLLLKTFEDREELKDFILQKDVFGENLIHNLLSRNNNSAIIKLTLEIIKQNFADQLQEIIKSKGKEEMNLLQYAAYVSNPVEVHQNLWEYFREFCGSDKKFLEMLKEVDGDERNILHIVAERSPCEVFGFMIQELEKLTSRDKVKEILEKLDNINRNLLQIAAEYNESLEFHKTLWNTFRNYFENSEILKFQKHFDDYGNNVLFYAVRCNTKEIMELTWNEIKRFLNHDAKVEYLKMKGKYGQNLLTCASTADVFSCVKILLKNYDIDLDS